MPYFLQRDIITLRFTAMSLLAWIVVHNWDFAWERLLLKIM